MNKFMIVAAVLASLSVAHAVPTVAAGIQNNFNIVPHLEKESRTILELPTIGSLLFKAAKAVFFLMRSGWSLIGFKVGAIALVANLIIWGLKHSFSIILGAAAMFGFCKITGKCTLDAIPKPLYDIGETLVYSAKQLDNGITLYENLSNNLPY